MTYPISVLRALVSVLCLLFVGVTLAAAQQSDPSEAPGTPPTVSPVAPPAGDDDAAIDLAQPDFTVVNLPTTMRLPLHKGDFHLTHRFRGNLEQGTFGQQAGTLFGLDDGASISFEYRYAVARHLEVAAARTSFGQTIELYSKYDAVHQGAVSPVSVSGLVSVEGSNNFQEQFAPAIGGVVSREIQDRAAFYASPVWVQNSAAAIGVNRDTFFVGLGGRVRIMSTTYLVAEMSPRVAGYAPGDVEYGFGLEKRVGGHVFQLNFTNGFGTTFGQIANGGAPQSLHFGFNLTRKFF